MVHIIKPVNIDHNYRGNPNLWQELKLDERPGRERLNYVPSCNLSATKQYFSEQRSNVAIIDI